MERLITVKVFWRDNVKKTIAITQYDNVYSLDFSEKNAVIIRFISNNKFEEYSQATFSLESLIEIKSVY